MSGPITAALLGGLILLTAASLPAWARSKADEMQLESVSNDIDRNASGFSQGNKTQTLSKQFNVNSSVIENLRAKTQGWGETTIELAMAQRLMQTNMKIYPTMSDALNKIAVLRSEHQGWGRIAHNLGFKLGPVVSDAMHTRNELRNDSRMDATLRVEKPGKAEKADRAVKLERTERPERRLRNERPARVEKASRAL